MSSIKNIILTLAYVFVVILPAACTNVNKATISSHKEETVSPWLKAGLLNSDRIKMKFGSYGLNVLAQDPESYRLSSLYSIDNEHEVTRTIALTTYESNMNEALKKAHEEIVQGGSIGSTLSKHGFKLIKEITFKGNVSEMPKEMNRLMNSNDNTFAALIYDLFAEKDGVVYPYSTIAEVYSPQYLTLSELNLIYPDSPTKDKEPGQVKEGLVEKASEEKVQAMINKMRDLMAGK